MTQTPLANSSEPIMISALAQYCYCPRRCALMHQEQTFDDNIYTLRGTRLHEKAHESSSEVVDGVRRERALPLYCESLGLYGVADVVEFLPDGTPYPVEYKAGARKKRNADDVQLCAQALCLEEMLGVSVPEGSVYYDRSKRRRVVVFDEALRQSVAEVTAAVRDLLSQSAPPAPPTDARCPPCSLLDACMPYALKNWQQQDVFSILDPP